jgi:hypothetical protein
LYIIPLPLHPSSFIIIPSLKERRKRNEGVGRKEAKKKKKKELNIIKRRMN